MIVEQVKEQVNYSLGSCGKKLSNIKNWIAFTEPERIFKKMLEINNRRPVLINPNESDLEFDLTMDEKINNAMAGRKTTTLTMVKMPYFEFIGDKFEFTGSYKSLPGNRTIRRVAQDPTISYSIKEITMANGEKVSFRTSSPLITLPQKELVYVDFVESSDKDIYQERAYQMCVDFIENGVYIDGVKYVYCESSSAQLMELKGVFVREDYKVSYFLIEKIEDPLYREYVDSLSGAEALLEISSFGAFSCTFTNNFAQWLMKDKKMSAVEVCEKYPEVETKNIEVSIARALSRIALGLTSSIPLGRNWKVLHIGKVAFEWNDKFEGRLRAMTYEREDGKIVPKYNDDDIDTLKKFWKKLKFDGAAIGRASKFKRNFKKNYKVNLSMGEVAYQVTQYRWGGCKGIVLWLPDEILDACVAPDGSYVYKGYDLIIEDKSWKYSPLTRFYKNESAPEFEYITTSKSRQTSYMSEQYVNALDEIITPEGYYDPEATLLIFKKLVDKNMAERYLAVDDTTGSTMKAHLGLTDSEKDGILDQIGVKRYDLTLRSKLAKVVDIVANAVKDPYCGGKYYDLYFPESKKTALGKLEVEGGTKFFLTDFICMLRTDLMVKNNKGLWDIVITDPDQTGMPEPDTIYWAGKDQEALVLRSPMIHPGEPFRTWLQGLDKLPEIVDTDYGPLYVRDMYSQCKHIIVFCGWTNGLEQLGGADIDGDKGLCVTDPDIIKLRRFARPALYVSIDSEELKAPMTMENIREYMIRSLRSNGVGLITNYATTWRDIQHYVIWCIMNGEYLPRKVHKAIKKAKKAAENNMKYGKYRWVQDDESIYALSSLVLYKDEDGEYFDLNELNSVLGLMLEQLRLLQETAIRTPKSGIRVEFGNEDETKNNHNHLVIDIRASWHRPDMDKSFLYNSKSPMGLAHKYAVAKWEDLKEYIRKNSVSLFPNADTYFSADLMKVFEKVNALKVVYGKAIGDISLRKRYREIDDEQFGIYFEELADFMHSELTALAVEHGVDKIAIMAYDASYKDGKKGASGKSFVWHCFFDEFLDTLRFYKTKAAKKDCADAYDDTRLYPVIKDLEYVYETIEDSEVEIVDNNVYVGDEKIGFCYKENGVYDMISVNDRLYIEDSVELKTIEELTTSLSGIKFKVVGFKFYLDEIANDGSMMTRDKLLEYLPTKLCQNIMRAKVNESKKVTNKMMVELYIRSGKTDNGDIIWSPIGAMEEGAINLARALNRKYFTVEYLGDKADMRKDGTILTTRASFIIDEVVFDEFQVEDEE